MKKREYSTKELDKILKEKTKRHVSGIYANKRRKSIMAEAKTEAESKAKELNGILLEISKLATKAGDLVKDDMLGSDGFTESPVYMKLKKLNRALANSNLFGHHLTQGVIEDLLARYDGFVFDKYKKYSR